MKSSLNNVQQPVEMAGCLSGRRAYYQGLAFLDRFIRLGEELPDPPAPEVPALLQARIVRLEQQLAQTRLDKHAAIMGEKALSQRIRTLANDWPALFVRYFTNKGLKDQALGKPTRTSKKPKRKTA